MSLDHDQVLAVVEDLAAGLQRLRSLVLRHKRPRIADGGLVINLTAGQRDLILAEYHNTLRRLRQDFARLPQPPQE